jgi:hypothetical protein
MVQGAIRGVLEAAVYQFVKVASLSVWTIRAGKGKVESTYWMKALETWLA